MNGVSMATVRWPDPRGFAAAAAAVSLVLVVVLSPDAARVHAADVFQSLRAPGEAAFVAGHRGDQEGAPENTLPAFELAIASQVEFIETDLQLTADGVPVLMHDWTVDRTTNGSGPVWAYTWHELSRLDAGGWYSDAFAGTRVPALSQLLALVRPSNKRVLLELKGSWNAEQLRSVTDDIERVGLDDRVIVASFDIMSLKALATVAPDLPRLVISRTIVGDPAVLAATCGAVALVTSARFVRDDPDAVTRIHDAGLGVLLYTLNDEETWSDATSLGVDGIITDRPARLDRWLADTRTTAPAAAATLETRRG
jgi:glycerophosphoryl diester phosphodiesterase